MSGAGDPGGWRTEHATRAALIVDAADYFRLARNAMLKAQRQLLLIGWDFDTRIRLDHGEPEDGAPVKLGPFLSWLAARRPELCIHILTWDLGALKLIGRGTTLLRLARWAWSPRISFQVDGAHPAGASHHQKMVVIDDCLAFCGGIDMTASRWDTRAHRDRDERRRRPFTGRRYMPWHDATMAVEGDVAKALGELARDRWQRARGHALPVPDVRTDAWPEGLDPRFRDIDVTIARTRGQNGDDAEIREIEAQFVAAIRSAERFVYAETQYFASRVIAEAICARLEEPDGPEFVIVNPKTADGWLEEKVMGAARAELVHAITAGRGAGRFRIYTPVTEGGEDIYVHAKIMIVDDKLLRVGSANMNNRSMGLDSECDLSIEGEGENARTIAATRAGLMAEHLGVDAAQVAAAFAATGSLIATVERLRGRGKTLLPFEPPETSVAEQAVAESEALDPERPGDAFEPVGRRGLIRGRLARRRHNG